MEQLEDSRKREEEEKRAREEKERITKEITEAKFHDKSNDLKAEAESIFSLSTKIPLGTWKGVEDKVDKLKHPDLTAQIAEAGINPDNILGWSNTRLAVNQVMNPIQKVSDELRSEDTFPG